MVLYSIFHLLFLSILILWALFRSIKIVQDNERLAIFRIGKFKCMAGPGLVLMIPFVDRAIRINLDQHISGWQALSTEELTEKVKEIGLHL